MAVYIEDVIREIQRLLKDDTYTPSILLTLINQGMREIASAVLPDGKEVLLPALEATGTIDTSTSKHYVALPSDFNRKLISVYSGTQGDYVQLDDSLAMLNKFYPDGLNDTGNIERCARAGNSLYYNPMPSSADTLTLHYFKKPTTLDFGDEISEIPEHMAIPLLKGYCLKEAFSEIELTNQQPAGKSVLWEQYYLARLQELVNFIGPYATDLPQISYEYGMLKT